MRKHTKVLLIASTLITSSAVTPALLAQDSREHGMMKPNAMMDRGMMGGGESEMMGMMKGMKQMSRMMGHCGNMMSKERPNDQWQKIPNSKPEKDG